jgi:uncharacterized membrane protein
MNNPLWRPSVADIQRVTDQPDAVGAKFKQGIKGPGGRIDGDYEIVELNPNKLIKFQVIAGPARPTGVYKFDTMGNSTVVTFILDFQPKGLAKVMDPLINKQMQSEVGTLANLKTYLESHA